MLRYDSSIIIDRPVEIVFEYMQDIDREREWQPNLREAEQLPKGEPGVGTRRRYVSEFMGKRFENVYVNTIYEPNRRVTYKSARESDTQAEGEITWEPVDSGTRVTMRVSVEVGGLLRFVPKSLITSLGTKELEDALARAKARLESSD
ncbi:MAG: SRPBCC family protein [Gemmatimonadota bacterium]|nr:MAG: SRPBCC family protein [Gemmatimonadota bacterium]